MKMTGNLFAFYDRLNRIIFLGRKSHPQMFIIDYDSKAYTIKETQTCIQENCIYSISFSPKGVFYNEHKEIAEYVFYQFLE